MRRRHNLFLLVPALVLSLVVGFPPSFAAPVSYFDMEESRFENITPFPKWTGMAARFSEQIKMPDAGCGKTRYHPCSLVQWKTLLQSLRDKPFRRQIDIVNHWGNGHPYTDDQVNWGVEDYWETPYEFMEISGDCEDYAIAKYHSMRALGIPAEQLRLIVVQDLNLGGIIHAVLGIYDGKELLILDNQIPQVKPALGIYHYRPIFGINEIAWWAYHPKSSDGAG